MSTWISFLVATVSWIAAFWFLVICEGVYLDFADGIAHFSISNNALTDTALFFDSWARPMHVLLSVLPAQFGYAPYILIHVVLTIATLYVSLELGRHWGLPLLWLVPWWISLNRAVAYVTMAGLTETLFMFIVMLSFLGLERKRWRFTACLLGASLYARPEALWLVVLGVSWMFAKNPQRNWWKIIGYVLLVPISMNLIEWSLGFGSKAMAFSAFSGSSLNIYGSGGWDHFFYNRVKWASTPMLLGVAISTVVLLVRAIRGQLHLVSLVLVYAWGVFVAHTVLWHLGLMGSLGLTRIMAIVVPALALIIHSAAGSPRWTHILLVLLFIAHIAQLIYRDALRFERSPQQILAENVASWIKTNAVNSDLAVQWRLPLFIAGLPSDEIEQTRKLWSLPPLKPSSGMTAGTVLIWDNVTGFREGGIDKEILDHDANLELVHAVNYLTLEARIYRKKKEVPLEFQLKSIAPWLTGSGVWERAEGYALRLRTPQKNGRIIGIQPSDKSVLLSWHGDSTGTVVLKFADGTKTELGSTGSFQVEPLMNEAMVLWRAERGEVLHQFNAVYGQPPIAEGASY